MNNEALVVIYGMEQQILVNVTCKKYFSNTYFLRNPISQPYASSLYASRKLASMPLGNIKMPKNGELIN